MRGVASIVLVCAIVSPAFANSWKVGPFTTAQFGAHTVLGEVTVTIRTGQALPRRVTRLDLKVAGRRLDVPMPTDMALVNPVISETILAVPGVCWP
ncbi:MAG TPA: hypothetical protein VLW26_05260, partial [Steroidobacteraceae bacterium]|nr:hypothetical protein [Steroidobacteraceae bacterium]